MTDPTDAEETPTSTEEEAAARDVAAEEALASAEADLRTSQEALFVTEAAPVPGEPDEDVTSFDAAPTDEIAAISAELAEGESSDETSEGTASESAPDGAIPPDEAEAVVAAGVPEGADDAADAVEALLDAETSTGVFEGPRDRTLSLPFWIYVGVWLVFAAAMVVVLRDAAIAGTLDTAESYPIFVFVGLVLTVFGPLLSVFLWVLKRSRSSAEERTGLFATALLRGALATFGGVVLWWMALVVLNYMKTGRLF